MRERKGTELINAEKLKAETKEKKAPRARNRTVMLDASETERVRSKFQAQQREELIDDGFISPNKLNNKTLEQSEEENKDNDNLERFESESGQAVFLEADSYDDVFYNSNEEIVDVEEKVKVSVVDDVQNEEVTYLVEPDVFEGQETNEFREPKVKSLNKESVKTKEETSLLNKNVFVTYTDSKELLGFLIYKNEESGLFSNYIELRKSRLIVTSIAPKGGEFIFINDESVSPMHAVLRISDNKSIQILDQLSENGTKLIKAKTAEEIELLGDKSTIEHGDKVIFGNFTCKICLIS